MAIPLAARRPMQDRSGHRALPSVDGGNVYSGYIGFIVGYWKLKWTPSVQGLGLAPLRIIWRPKYAEGYIGGI